MVSKKRYSKTKRRFKNQKGTKNQKGSKKRVRKYRGGKASRPGQFESVVVSQAPIIPMNMGEEVVPEPVPVNLNDAFIENSFEEEEEDYENNDDNNNVFDDLYTDLHPQELGLEGGSKKSSFKSTFLMKL